MIDKENQLLPTFSLKSAMLLFLAGLIGGILIPYVFHELTLDARMGALIFLPLLISLTVAYAQCFIETKVGFGRRFYGTFLLGSIVLGTAAYFWLFKGFIF